MANAGPKNTDKFVINNQYFMGGSALDFKMGIANSHYYSDNLDFRTFPSQMSVLPESRAIATNLQDCIQAMQQDITGTRWAVGHKGFIYKIDSNNAVSNVGQILGQKGAAGMLYSQITNQLYIPGRSTISTYGPVGVGTPALLTNFAASASSAFGCVALYNTNTGYFDGNAGYRNNIITDTLDVQSGITIDNYQTLVTNALTNTYVLPNTIQEDSTDFCFFAPDIEPMESISVFVNSIGTGDWTLTVHDSLNNIVASNTVTHANMVTGWVNVLLVSDTETPEPRLFVNASNVGYAPTYHFHLTSSVANDTASVFTFNPQDLTGCNFVYFAHRLVTTNNGWHPTAYFTGTGTALLCVGNANYLATYNFGNDLNPSNSQFQRHTLTFTPGEEVCGLSTNYGYLVIATERRSTDPTRNSQLGRLYFWDGSTDAPNFFIDIPMGSPYGLYSTNNITYFACAGSLYAWSGGQTVIKVRKLAYQNTDYMDAVDETRVNPNAFTSRYNIMMMGYPSTTTDTALNFGIWSWGTVELTYPNSYGLSYTQSPDILNYSAANQYQLGCCVNFVDSMYSSWGYVDANSVQHYGLDVVDNFSDPAPTFTWQSLIFDGGVVYKEKMAVRYKIYFEALPTGVSLTPWYIIDRGDKVEGNTVEAGDTEAFIEMNNARFHELQWGFDGASDDTAIAPAVILGISMEIDPLTQEVDLERGEQ
jgi:hypothetical protein